MYIHISLLIVFIYLFCFYFFFLKNNNKYNLIQPNIDTRRFIIEEGHIQYDSNSYSEDLPYWITSIEDGTKLNKPHLIIPFTLTENDNVYNNGLYNNGTQFCEHLKKTLKELYDDANTSPSTMKLMTISLHCRNAKPGYINGISEFLDYIYNYYSIKNDVWLCTREQIAYHWYHNHYPIGAGEIILPWYMAQNNINTNSNSNTSSTSNKSTLEKTKLKIQQQSSTSNTNNNSFSYSLASTFHNFIAPKPPEEELGESDII